MSDNHLNLNVVLSLREVMGEDYDALLAAFFSDSDERLRLMSEALQSADAEQLRHVAHSFKGSSSNLGAQVLSDLCWEMEQAAQRCQLLQAQSLLSKLRGEFDCVRAKLTEVLSAR